MAAAHLRSDNPSAPGHEGDASSLVHTPDSPDSPDPRGEGAAPSPPPQPLAEGVWPALSAGAAGSGMQRFVFSGLAIALTLAALHYGQALLMPLAFAALLAFVLDPLVRRLRRWRLPQALAVSVVIVATFALLAGIAYVVVQQVGVLASDVPKHEATIRKKLRELRPTTRTAPALSAASQVIDTVEGELNAVRDALPGAAPKTKAPVASVRVEPAPTPALQSLVSTAMPVLVPLGTVALVAVLLAFMLSQRRELYDRVLRLAGDDMHRMSDALGEAGHRVSHYLSMHLLVNLSYGVPLGLGLWWIGVPGALLWGFVAVVLRFVPYLGPAVAAVPPLLLAFAIDPGWQMLIWTAALILTLELISNNVVEPLAYAGKTGVSPLAVLVSAAFWALVWGPVGLVLATPLTVCLVVLGKYIAPLRFLDLMLGSNPALDPPTLLYQRFIAGDEEEAIELASQQAAASSLVGFYSDTGMALLALADRNATQRSTNAHRHRVVSGIGRMIEDLRIDHPAAATGTAQVLCIGARNELDTLSADMLAHALGQAGIAARAVPALALRADRIGQLVLDGSTQVCVCSFSPAPETHTRFVVRRLHKLQPGLRITLAAWAAPSSLGGADAASTHGADRVVLSLKDAVAVLQAEAAEGSTAPRSTAPSDPDSAARPAAGRQQNALERGAQQARDVFSVAMASVLLGRAGTPQLQARAAQPGAAASEPLRVLDGSPLSAVLGDGVPRVLGEVSRDEHFAGRQEAPFAGFKFFAAAPLRAADGAVCGVLALHDTSPRKFTPQDTELLEQMARELSVAVQAAAATPVLDGASEADAGEAGRAEGGPAPLAAAAAR